MNWIGDIGGFAGVVIGAGFYLCNFYNQINSRNKLVSAIFKYADLRPLAINRMHLCSRNKISRMRDKALKRIERETDIIHLIKSLILTKSFMKTLTT